MSFVNSLINRFFDFIFIPFRHAEPLWALTWVSVLVGMFMLVIFRFTSNQHAIKKVKDRLKAHLMEIRLFKDDARVFFSALKYILIYNVRYLKCATVPMAVMMVPVIFILIQLNGWFEHRPLIPGESAVVSVKFHPGETNPTFPLSIHAGEGIAVETPPLRIPVNREVDWRIRAISPGNHTLLIESGEHVFRKEIVVSENELVRVSSLAVAPSFGDLFLNPGEKPLKPQPRVQYIEVLYPERNLLFMGWRIDWIVWFFALSIFSGLLFKGFIKVQI